MDKVINIPTNSHIFYTQYLTILNPILGVNKLRPKELELLGKFIELYSLLPQSAPHDMKCISIFTSQSVKQILLQLGISRSNYDSILKSLITKGLIISTNKVKTLRQDVILRLEPDTKIIFNFITKR